MEVVGDVDGEDFDELNDLELAWLAVPVHNKVLSIPKPVDTRWSSTYNNMKRVYTLRVALQSYATRVKPLPGDFNMASYERCADVVDILGPVAALNTALQSSTKLVIVQLLPAVLCLLARTLENPGRTASDHSGRTP